MGERKSYVLKRNDLLYPEISYKINGVLFEVYKEIGGGHEEKYYQKGVAVGFRKENINFVEQYFVPLTCFEEKIGKYYLDFLIENKIILELKRGQFISAQVIDQVKKYLISTNLKLGIIACFTYKGVVIKRIINEY